MAALTEQQLSELLEEAFLEGVEHSHSGSYSKDFMDGVTTRLVARAHVSTMYHGARGDAAQEYIEQFFKGHRDWEEFRWNEVWDRMHAVAPLDVKGDAHV